MLYIYDISRLRVKHLFHLVIEAYIRE